ncbi:MAG: TolC family protein [Acidobacteriota bacterium]
MPRGLVLAGLALSLALSIPGSASRAESVVIWDESGAFDALAAEIASEVGEILAPEPVEWQIEVSVGAGAPANLSPEATLVLLAAPSTPLDGLTTRIAAEPRRMLLVDALGWGLDAPDSDRVRQLSAPSFDEAVAADLALLQRLVGDAPRLVALVDPALAQVGPRLEQLAQDSVELTVLEGAAGEEHQVLDVLAARRGGDDRPAVYLTSASRLDAAELAPGLLEGDLAGVSGRGRADVEAGLLAARSGDRRRLVARAVALEVLAAVRGLAAPPAATGDAGSTRPVVNFTTAAGLGLDLPWRLRLDADAVGEAVRAAGRLTTLEQARQDVIERNLELLAGDLAVAASEQEIERAISVLRPRLLARLETRRVDEESALAAVGSLPERQTTALGEASWLLVSEDARAAVAIERRLQLARELELEQVRLDLGLAATAALLDVARTAAFEQIARDDLQLSRFELDTARDRRRVGAGGRADVARLEARTAGARRALVAEYGARRSAEIAFNRLVDRPLDEGIDPVLAPMLDNALERSADTQVDAQIDAVDSLPWAERVGSPRALASLRAELLVKAADDAPELAAAESIVEARRRAQRAARRAFYLPTVRAFAQVGEILDEGGAGDTPPDLGFPGGGAPFPDRPDTSYSFGLGAELTLWSGGERTARETRAALEVEAAETLWRDAERAVEERVLRALVFVETSYEAAAQAAVAAEAAAEAFEVVRDGYASGAESLTTLLDAQTALRVARQEAAAAVYDAQIRFAELQRASGSFFDPSELYRN